VEERKEASYPFCPFPLRASLHFASSSSPSASSLVVIGTREHLRGFPFPLRFPLRCSRRLVAASSSEFLCSFSTPFFPCFFLLVCLITKIPAACSASSSPFSPSLLLLLLLCFSSGPLCFCFHAGFGKTGLGTIIVLFVFACLLASTEICRLANFEGCELERNKNF